MVNAATYGLFMLRRTTVWLKHPRLGRAGTWLGAPMRLVAPFLQRPLSKVLLLGVEVAMEYLLGLTSSPYVQWLQVGGGGRGGAWLRTYGLWRAQISRSEPPAAGGVRSSALSAATVPC